MSSHKNKTNRFICGDKVKLISKPFWGKCGRKVFLNPQIVKVQTIFMVREEEDSAGNYELAGDKCDRYCIHKSCLLLVEKDGKKVTAGKIKEPKVNFLLKCELGEDPIEEFTTLSEVRKRIKFLLAEGNIDLENHNLSHLYEDSFVVYDIAQVRKVKISKQVIIE